MKLEFSHYISSNSTYTIDSLIYLDIGFKNLLFDLNHVNTGYFLNTSFILYLFHTLPHLADSNPIQNPKIPIYCILIFFCYIIKNANYK